MKNHGPRFYLLILLHFVSIGAYAANDRESFLCYGPGYMYSLTAPANWKLDNESGKSNGLCVVAYPKGGSWGKSETVMYANVSTKDKTVKTVDDMIASDVKRHRSVVENVVVREGDPIQVNGKKVPVRHFIEPGKNGNHEAIAYVENPESVTFIVLTSRSESGFKRELPAFSALVRNYKFIASAQVTPPLSNSK